MGIAALALFSAFVAAGPAERAPDAPVLPPPPAYRAECPGCAAIGLQFDGFDRFHGYVQTFAPASSHRALFRRQSVARAAGLWVGAAGVVAASGFFWVPWSCTDLPTNATDGLAHRSCNPTMTNYALVGLGAGVAASGILLYTYLRPSEAELVASVNQYNREHPDQPFHLTPPEVDTGGPEPAALPLPSAPEVRRPGVIPALAIGVGTAAVASYFFVNMHNQRRALDDGSVGTLYGAQQAMQSGEQSQVLYMAVGAASVAAFGAATFFAIHADAQGPQVQVAVAPGGLSLSGVFQ